MEETLVPIFLFGSIVATFWLIGHFNFKKRQTAYDTVRHAIDGGQQISTELVESMALIFDPVRADLRRGVLFVAVGLAIMVLGTIVASHEQEAVGPIFGIASFPIIIGIAYLGLWKFGHGRKA